MTIAVAPPKAEPLRWPVVRRSWVAVRVAELRQDSWFVRLATVGAGAYAAVLPLLQLYRFSTQFDQGHLRYAVAATACYLPFQVWLVLSATRDAGGRGRGWALAALAALTVGLVPVIGVGWLGATYGLAALLLVSVRAPWSLLLFAALVAVPTPVAFAAGHPEWASYSRPRPRNSCPTGSGRGTNLPTPPVMTTASARTVVPLSNRSTGRPSS
jgi:hypothetical protein